MPSTTPFRSAEDPHVDDAAGANSLFERCLEQTLHALLQTGAAERLELETMYAHCLEAIQQGKPADPLQALARLRGTDEEFMSSAIAPLSLAVATTMMLPPPTVPFATKLIAPNAFYEMFPSLVELGRGLRVPVIFAEDTDAIGVGSINPLAAELFADEIVTAVHQRFGIRPFLSVVRLDYESWSFLLRKHYGL